MCSKSNKQWTFLGTTSRAPRSPPWPMPRLPDLDLTIENGLCSGILIDFLLEISLLGMVFIDQTNHNLEPKEAGFNQEKCG